MKRNPKTKTLKIRSGKDLARYKAQKPKIKIEDGSVIIYYEYPYVIDLERLQTPIQLLGWVNHLMEKNWMTKLRLYHFMSIVAKHQGFDLYQT